ncbi:DJ-1/PfpI family protein [Chloroflexia bacterium SDU3-3]|nr:DJ-1/PfpI family protein [Chloroflexia bacterium SDU3-3]
MNTTHGLSVGMLLFPNLTQLDLTGPYEIFARMPNTKITLLGETMAPVRSDRGLSLLPQQTFDEAGQFDLIMVPGGPGVTPLMEHEPTLGFLRAQAAGARYTTSVCTGALLLGAAGLLRGYRATTHWMSLDLLPLFGAEPCEARYVVDRDRITGGGVTAGVDFALAVAAELYGRDVAQRIQLMVEYDPAPPFAGGTPATARPELLAQVIEQARPLQEQRREIAQRVASRL